MKGRSFHDRYQESQAEEEHSKLRDLPVGSKKMSGNVKGGKKREWV
jgi:hypothetical protein